MGMDGDLAQELREAHAFLRARRLAADPPPDHTRRNRWLVGALLLAHVAGVLVLRESMKPEPYVAVENPRESVTYLTFVEADADAEVLEPVPSPVPPSWRVVPAPRAVVRTSPRPVQTPPSPPTALPRAGEGSSATASAVTDVPIPTEPSTGMSARFVEAAPSVEAPQLRLFSSDGTLLLSKEVIAASEIKPRVPDFIDNAPTQVSWWDQPPVVPYNPSVFENMWAAPKNENLVNYWVRRAILEKTFKTPWGGKVKCAWVLVIGACTW